MIDSIADGLGECVELLSQLGRYEFNLSVGNEYRFRHQEWLSSDEVVRAVEQVGKEHRGTGDVYARAEASAQIG